MEVRETLWKRCLSTPTTPPAKNSNICLSETSYQHKGTRKKCKKTNQAAIIQWQRQCLMVKPHRRPWPKSKTSDVSMQSPSLLHHTFSLGRARFTSQPLSAQRPGSTATVLGTGYWSYPILPFGIVACTFFPTTFLEIAVNKSTHVTVNTSDILCFVVNFFYGKTVRHARKSKTKETAFI